MTRGEFGSAKVLILDGHSKAAAETVLALPRDCVLHVAAESRDALALGSPRVQRALLQPRGEVAVREWLCTLDAQEGYAMIVASTETSLLALKAETLPAALRSKALLAAEASIDIALSKQRTMELAAELGIRVPRSRIIASLEEAGEGRELPIVVKPLQSKVLVEGSLRTLEARICNDAAARSRALQELLPHTAVVEQEYFRGRGVGVELLFEHGRLCWSFAHERLHEMPVTGGASTYRRACTPPAAVQEAAVALMQRLQWHGVAMVEFKVAPDGDHRLIEINPRLWGSLPLAVGAGFNFPLGMLRLAAGRSPGPQPKPTRLRHARDIAADLRWFVQSWRQRSHPLLVKPLQWRDFAALLRPLAGVERWDLFRWAEPQLWWRLSRGVFSAIASRIVQRLRRRAAARQAADRWRTLGPSWQDGRIRRIVVLCYGNICRSPLVAAALQRSLQDVEVLSAGFHERSDRSSPPAWIEVVKETLQIDLSAHRSRTVDERMMAQADLVIVMDAQNWHALAERHPAMRARSTLLSVAAAGDASAGPEVPDPYGRTAGEMRAIAQQIGRHVERMAAARRKPAAVEEHR